MQPVMQKRVTGAEFRYLRPAKRRPTQYEEVTLHTQWDPKNFAKQGWFSPSASGRPMWDEHSTRLRARDWWGYRDPAQQWFRPYVEQQARHEEAIELAVEGAKRSGLLAELTPRWRDILATYYAAYRYLEYGFFLCFCYVQREALSDVVATPLVFQGLDKDRHAQAIALYGMDLEEALPGWSDANAQTVWLTDPIYQPSREYVERLLACRDWGEITVASNLIFEPLVATLITREFLARFAPHHGDSVTPVILDTVDADRRRNVAATVELVRFLLADTPANRTVIAEWVSLWTPRAVRAAHACAPLFTLAEKHPLTFATAWQRVTTEYRTLLQDLGLPVPQEVQA
ncbi:MAG: monooxygenase [Candidatus Binatia bacterium]|nr:monooxygenase [Candidatus Binatia bacterium]